MKTILVSLLVAACGACSSGSGASGSGAFPISVVSDSKALHIELGASPLPAVGTNTVELTVTRFSDGAPLDGFPVDVVPCMPARHPGTSTPTVTPEGEGKYRVSELYFFMPGTWVLKTSFSGPVSDHAEPEFEIQ